MYYEVKVNPSTWKFASFQTWVKLLQKVYAKGVLKSRMLEHVIKFYVQIIKVFHLCLGWIYDANIYKIYKRVLARALELCKS